MVERPAQECQLAADLEIVLPIGGRLDARLGIAPEHLESVERPAAVAGGDAATDLAQPEVRPIDPRENGALSLRDEEDLLAEIGQVGFTHAEIGEAPSHIR